MSDSHHILMPQPLVCRSIQDHFDKEVIYRQERTISGIRQDLQVAVDQISKSPRTRQQNSTRLERRFTIVLSYGRYHHDRSLSGPLPPILLRVIREIYKVSLTRRFWFGLLMITSTTDTSWTETIGDNREFEVDVIPFSIRFSFLPPSWVSDMFIRINMKSSMTINFDRTRINQDPRLMKCLETCDVEGSKALFSQGKATPNDLVLDLGDWWIRDKPESLMMVISVYNSN